MKAEEYFKEWGSICRIVEAYEPRMYRHSELLHFAEAYHKAEVESNFEEIYNVITYYGIDEPKASVIWNQIKNKLLKQ